MAGMDNTTAHALVRFGLGARPSERTRGDPQRWLDAQLIGPDTPPPGVGLPEAFAAIRQDLAEPPAPGQRTRARDILRAELLALVDRALVTDTPFRERLVHFWANHFTVSLRRGQIAPLIGDYVREAIRPHVTGRFGDMLLAVMRHPAMLIYLDNAASVGPDSRFGQRAKRGLNENLARECLELHTCSPAAGYTQADVTEFAKVLTGWSVEREKEPVGFRFRPAVHQPGPKTVMGRGFPPGEQGGMETLAWLAAHPATHRHLATKLVRHFVADDPPQDAIRRVEGALRDSGGDLGAAARAVTRLPQAWQEGTKLRTPQEYLFAALRASALPPERRPNVLGIAGGLGQAFFNAPFPIGWPDRAADWAGPEAVLRRIDWAYGFAARAELPDPEALAETALGPLLRANTAAEMRRAGSRRDAVTLLLASPEFQRR